MAVLFFGCKQQPQEVTADAHEIPAQQEDSLYYEFETFQKKFGECATDTAAYCTIIDLSYPMFESAVESSHAAEINRQIEAYVLEQFFPDTAEHKSIEGFAKQFISDYRDIKAAFGDAFGWHAKLNSKVLRNDSAVVTIELSSDLYTGGAHGNTRVQYLNFSRQSGKEIPLDAVFAPGYEEKLNKIVEQQFRKKYKIKPEGDLSDEGFQFENEKYYNEDNFALLPERIKFYFNNYEIAPYSSGPSEIFVSYNELKDILIQGNPATTMTN